ncbi:response regulator [Chloroflexota bacterium]
MIVDDHPLVRQSLKTLINNHAEFVLVGEAGDGEQAVDLAIRKSPDIILMDITLPGINGIEATRRIKSKSPKIKVLALTVHDDEEMVISILEAGADGYLTKNILDEGIITAIKATALGENVISSPLLARVLKNRLRSSSKDVLPEHGETANLNYREEQILKLMAKGKTNREIATTLSLAEQTVKGYLVQVFSKLQANSRTEALAMALREGFLSLEDLS